MIPPPVWARLWRAIKKEFFNQPSVGQTGGGMIPPSPFRPVPTTCFTAQSHHLFYCPKGQQQSCVLCQRQIRLGRSLRRTKQVVG